MKKRDSLKIKTSLQICVSSNMAANKKEDTYRLGDHSATGAATEWDLSHCYALFFLSWLRGCEYQK